MQSLYKNPAFFLMKWILFSVLLLWQLDAVAVEKIRIMALFQDKAMVEIDGKNRLLRKGEPSPEGVLLISADSKGAVLEIDGQQESYQLGNHVGGTFKQREATEVKIWRDNTGSFTTVGSINGRTVNMLVDTGASSVALSEREAIRLGVPYRLKGKKIMVSTASGRAMGYEIALDQVKIGGLMLRNVEAMVIEGDSPAEVLLGMTFLNRVQMENQGSVMVLRRRF
jgi:aspartyl protease family protein